MMTRLGKTFSILLSSVLVLAWLAAPGAAYPVTIAPLNYREVQVIAPDGAEFDSLGASVALLSDGAALVGAPKHSIGENWGQGAAYVFTRSGTAWTPQAKLTAPDGGVDDQFGYSVALSGDTALVGATGSWGSANNSLGRANYGRRPAYVFTRSGTTWSLQQQLAASDGTWWDRFGVSVALWGDTALVGVDEYDDNADPGQGSAYVFVRSGTSWTQQAKLTASDGAVDDGFGRSVALSGDIALVGAPNHDFGADESRGAAYIFTRSGTTWTQQGELIASDGATGDEFGSSVALVGEGAALVGAPRDNVGANIHQGAAYIFTHSGTTWIQQAKLTASDGEAEDYFGSSVALAGIGTALVGAAPDDVGANQDQGAVYIFTRSETTWTQQGKLTASNGAAGDGFGASVATSDDGAILVGAPGDDVGANEGQGSAYVYFLLKVYLPLVLRHAP